MPKHLKANNLKVFGSKNPKGPKQDSQKLSSPIRWAKHSNMVYIAFGVNMK